MPSLNTLYSQFSGQGLAVLGVTVDRKSEDAAAAAKIVRARGEFIRNGILPVIMDNPSDQQAGAGVGDRLHDLLLLFGETLHRLDQVRYQVGAALQGHTLKSWKKLLHRIAQARLPKRRKPRPSEPRAIRTFRSNVATLVGSRAAARAKLAKSHANS